MCEDTVDKLRKMFAFLDDMGDPEELRAAAFDALAALPPTAFPPNKTQ
jgi:hypothetical protein